MKEISSFFVRGNSLTEEENSEIKDRILIPAYDKFCKDLDLPLHFWCYLPMESYDSNIKMGERFLHKEAIEIFDRLRPQLMLFDDRIVESSFSIYECISSPKECRDHGSFTSWPTQEFVEKSFDQNQLKDRLNIVAGFLSLLVVGVGMIFFLTLLRIYVFGNFFSNHENLGMVFAAAMIIGTFVLASKIARRMATVQPEGPKQARKGSDFDTIAEKLNNLRSRIAELHGLEHKSFSPIRRGQIEAIVIDYRQRLFDLSKIKLKHNLFILDRLSWIIESLVNDFVGSATDETASLIDHLRSEEIPQTEESKALIAKLESAVAVRNDLKECYSRFIRINREQWAKVLSYYKVSG